MPRLQLLLLLCAAALGPRAQGKSLVPGARDDLCGSPAEGGGTDCWVCDSECKACPEGYKYYEEGICVSNAKCDSICKYTCVQCDDPDGEDCVSGCGWMGSFLVGLVVCVTSIISCMCVMVSIWRIPACAEGCAALCRPNKASRVEPA